MATVTVYNSKKEEVGTIDLKDEVFAVPVKPHVLHEVVLMQLASRRAGSANTKGRAEVRGGGRKPWRQKGTGRARAGSRRSPLWRGGGVIFGPKPREFTPKVNKKVRKLALKMALSSKLQEHQLLVLDDLNFPEIKTKAFIEVLRTFGLEKTLVVLPAANEVVERSARNVPYTKVLRSEGLNVYDVLRYDHLVVLKEAVPQIEAALAN